MTSFVSLTASMVTRPFELHSMPDQFLQQSVIGSHVVKTEALLNWDLIPSRTFLSFVLHIVVEKERLREEIKRMKVKIGFVSDIVVGNSVMSMYIRCREFGDAMKVFDEMPQRNVGSFNVIISGCAALGNLDSSLYADLWNFFRRMQCQGYNADAFTVASLLPMCCDSDGKFDHGRELHCYLVKNGLDLKMGSDVHMGDRKSVV